MAFIRYQPVVLLPHSLSIEREWAFSLPLQKCHVMKDIEMALKMLISGISLISLGGDINRSRAWISAKHFHTSADNYFQSYCNIIFITGEGEWNHTWNISLSWASMTCYQCAKAAVGLASMAHTTRVALIPRMGSTGLVIEWAEGAIERSSSSD